MNITPAHPGESSALIAIERAAVQLFRGHPIWPYYRDNYQLPEDVEQAIAEGRVFVARQHGEAVGFIMLEATPDGLALGIVEFDVRPEYGQCGLGADLLEHACRWGQMAGYTRIDLGTSADVPWNAAFYAKHGFVRVDGHDPRLDYARERERAHGFPEGLRVLMSRPLAFPARDAWTAWPAPAKLNLFLRITGRRADGYHELQTVFRLLDWGDEIHLRVRANGVLRRVNDVPGVPEDDDLVIRAARSLQRYVGTSLGAEIAVDKRIPMGGGLGGGSSDAATVLVALDALWDCRLGDDTLAELGSRLGADVPVFVRGRSAWAEGIGERLTPIDLPKRWYVVLDPQEQVPTAALFQVPELTRDAPVATMADFVSGEAAENAFEAVVRMRHPQVAQALDWLAGYGTARLSGSGGCVFFETPSRALAHRVMRECPGGWSAKLARGVADSSLRARLQRHGGS